MRVLISDKLSEAGLAIFKRAQGVQVDYQPGLGKDIPKLKEAIKTADAIAIRSGTTLTADILECAGKLKVIGRAGIGVDNVDVAAASKKGIIVMNTPFGNTVTTAEHAISMMCALTRQIPQATASIKAGKWEKNRFMGSELYEKTLGVIGCGNIGKIVADRAKGLRMNVITFDPFLTDEVAEKIGVTKVDLDTLFKDADYITLHIPKTEKTANLLNKDTFAKMKKGVYIINCARGGIINELDLADAISSGQVAGVALDVFAKEPVDPNHPLLKLDQVICTPHLGAATEEAQENVALDVAHQIVAYLTTGTVQNAVNFPSVSGEIMKALAPFLPLAEKLGSLQGQLATESPTEIVVELTGELSRLPGAPIMVSVLRGVLKPILGDDSVNLVNAPSIAKERGIRVTEMKISDHEDFSSLITVKLKFKDKEQIVAGTIFGKTHPRIIRVNEYDFEAVPEGCILIIRNQDTPGVVGNVGTLLAKHKINISRLQLGLAGKQAMAFYSVGGIVNTDVLDEIKKVPGIVSVQKVVL
ncbi:MAG TPA: phosphoglycerate dehydrogenase [Deltaproteobacteria bacterium]|nr:MAG: phosphoglycerate dehydrogenase [Deltaproteobacteria bacterium GWA2_45_12]HBF13572.1 phosphoglycerate dehydrogenase [Deltaproteobacteria bacterium]